MAEKNKKMFGVFQSAAQKTIGSVNMQSIKDKASEAGSAIAGKAVEARDAAMTAKEDITEKLTELDRMLQESITEYNDAYTLMNDKGIQLYVERSRAVDSISFVESVVNSISCVVNYNRTVWLSCVCIQQYGKSDESYDRGHCFRRKYLWKYDS